MKLNNPFLFIVSSCPAVSDPVVISDSQSVLVDDIFPEASITLLGVPMIQSFAVGIEVSREYSAALLNESLLPCFAGWSFPEWCVLIVVGSNHFCKYASLGKQNR